MIQKMDISQEISLENIKKSIRNPKQAVDTTLLEVGIRLPITYINTKTTIGTNVFSQDWDVLILLDTCRVDALREVASEYDFISDINSMRSVGGSSPEWIAKTFVNKYAQEINETAYISANAFSSKIISDHHHEKVSWKNISLTSWKRTNLAYKLLSQVPTVDVSSLGRFEDLYSYEPVGEEGSLGHKEGGTPPRYVTDRAITVSREFDFDRMILHYLQPHPPYSANAIQTGRELELHEKDWWEYIGRTGDRETIWETYLDELRYVLDDVEVLLENIDADTVAISSDHGEAFGEYWEFGHYVGSINPKVRNVPWAETSAEDSESYSPSTEPPSEEDTNGSTDRQLEALGYKM